MTVAAFVPIVSLTRLNVQLKPLAAPRTWNFCCEKLIIDHELLEQIVPKRAVHKCSFRIDAVIPL
jgi:hypothetical protein